jgi:hypothetical protein
MHRLLTVFGLAVLVGCQDQSPPLIPTPTPTPTPTVTGTWTGDMNSTSGHSAAVNPTLTQNGTVVSGSGQIKAGGITSASTATGTYAAPTLSLTVSFGAGAGQVINWTAQHTNNSLSGQATGLFDQASLITLTRPP